MRISAKGEYAIKAVLDLALRGGDGLVPIQDIAARHAIPQRYLEHVLLALKRAGLLGSKRGASGGYHLMRLPEEISVGTCCAPSKGRRRRSRRAVGPGGGTATRRTSSASSGRRSGKRCRRSSIG